ncbi:Cell division protein ZapD, partial [Dissostichus eleginoides]
MLPVAAPRGRRGLEDQTELLGVTATRGSLPTFPSFLHVTLHLHQPHGDTHLEVIVPTFTSLRPGA